MDNRLLSTFPAPGGPLSDGLFATTQRPPVPEGGFTLCEALTLPRPFIKRKCFAAVRWFGALGPQYDERNQHSNDHQFNDHPADPRLS